MRKHNVDIFSSGLYMKYDQWSERIASMSPSDEKISALKSFIHDIEADMLDITGDVLDFRNSRVRDLSPDQFDLLDCLLLLRGRALNNMFEIHCSDEEVRRFAAVNDMLYDMTERMYERARMVNELIKTMPLHKKDDDVDVEAKLKFWEDGASSVLELEDDGYYGSDFSRMIVLLAIIDRDYKFYDEIEQANLCPHLVDGKVVSDDDIINDLDDGTTWAEASLRHPKLDHLVICHAVHDICTHKNYSIPDLLRMNTFEVSVEMKVQQIQDQDGARCFWLQNHTPGQIKDKLLSEAEHRPAGMSLGDFIYRRCQVYYETMVEDVSAELDCRGRDENVIPFIDALLSLE